MSRIDRRHMLKVMAATAAGGAAAAVTRVGGALPALAASPGPRSPLIPAPTSATTGPRLATTPGVHYKHLDGLSDFNFRYSSTSWGEEVTRGGSIYPINQIDWLWTNFDLPHGAVLTEIILSVIVNDANPASWYFIVHTPSLGGSASPANGTISTTSLFVQNVSLAIPPTTIDNSQYLYGLYYGFGTAGASYAHLFVGARLGWLNNPGLTLFPDPRRCLGNGTTTLAEAFILNIDATLKSTAGGGPTGVPAGAKAAFCAVQAYQPGVMTLYPAGTADTGTANWSVQGTSGQLQMLYMLVPLDSTGKFNIHNRFTDKQIYVDVWGYLM